MRAAARLVFGSVPCSAPMIALAALVALAGCAESTTPGPGPMDAGRGGVDTGTPPMEDAGGTPVPDAGRMPPRDGGSFMFADAGACDAPRDLGDPITGLRMHEWTYVAFDQPGQEAYCMNGTTTGIGINLGTSNRVLVYLEGGGACFDFITCSSVAGQDGFDGADLGTFAPSLDRYGIFNRSSMTNPMRDWTFVYVPYCTGDVHGGTNPAGFGGRRQVGYTNMTRYLRRVVPTFPDAEQVLLTGSSAGGFGALVNYDQAQTMWGCSPVYMLDDSGPPMSDDTMRPCLQQKTREFWNIVVPEDCPQCAQEDGGGLVNVWPYLAQKYPDRRFGLLSTMGDMTIRFFYGFGNHRTCSGPAGMSVAQYTRGLEDLRDNIFSPYDGQLEVFFQPGEGHTFLGRSLDTPMAGGITLAEWIRRFLNDEPTWTDVGP